MQAFYICWNHGFFHKSDYFFRISVQFSCGIQTKITSFPTSCTLVKGIAMVSLAPNHPKKRGFPYKMSASIVWVCVSTRTSSTYPKFSPSQTLMTSYSRNSSIQHSIFFSFSQYLLFWFTLFQLTIFRMFCVVNIFLSVF